LLQGHVPQDQKFTNQRASALQWYGSQLAQSSADLVVTPETALPMATQHLPEGYWPQLVRHFSAGAQAALIGLPLLEEGQYHNSAVGLHAGAAYRYDKSHLVPFGEFVPPLFRWFTQMMNIPLGDFGRGTSTPPSFDVAGQRLAPNICYEDLFGEELAVRFRDPLQSPTLLVNMSNLAWFGNTVALDQHLTISRLRTLELARPMIRATNSGTTAIIDHRGQVTHRLAPETRGVLVGEVMGQAGPPTFFAWWAGRWGLGPLWGFCLAVTALALGVRWRKSLKAGS
jgi:apolipoprotein N-acyltransferase